jgi:hypothetical protein
MFRDLAHPTANAVCERRFAGKPELLNDDVQLAIWHRRQSALNK